MVPRALSTCLLQKAHFLVGFFLCRKHGSLASSYTFYQELFDCKTMNLSTQKPLFFVLGSRDHEMREIERVCQEEGLPYAYAHQGGSVVKSSNAYAATGIGSVSIPSGAHVVCVECAVMGLTAHDIIDHHNPNDPGYGKPPAQFYEGSSLGQFLTMIGREPTTRQRIIAAADHCLSAAYRGECPGIAIADLLEFRETTRAEARGMTREALQAQIHQATNQLQGAPQVMIAGASVAWFDRNNTPREIAEASARLSQPYVSITERDDGRIKAVLQSAPAKAVRAWLSLGALVGTYGDPQRGFAGGYMR